MIRSRHAEKAEIPKEDKKKMMVYKNLDSY